MAGAPSINIDINKNGGTTLATEGKYCESDIEINVHVPIPDGYIKPTGSKSITSNGTHDVTSVASAVVNVPVPSGYIKPSGSKTITENGTHDVTQYASAVVNVAEKPTQFTNVLAYADSLEVNKRFATNGSYTNTQPNAHIAVTLDLNKLPNPKVLQRNKNELRFRGCHTSDNAFAQSSDGATYSAKGVNSAPDRVDEYGDMVFTRGYISERYVRFNILYALYPASGNAALPDDFDPVAAGCVVTFNEPIGYINRNV